MGKRIVFCGVGALGSNAVFACRNLGATLRFVDFDRVETKNLAAQAYMKPSLGKNKAEALKQELLGFYGLRCEAFPVRLEAHNARELCAEADLLVDAFDNRASRLVLSDYARNADKPLLHAALAADGTFGLVRWDERFTPDAEDAPGAATCEGGEHLPLIALVAACLARSVQDFLRDGARHDWMVSLSGAERMNA